MNVKLLGPRVTAWAAMLAVTLAALGSSAAASADTPAAAAPAYSRKGADTCLGCHDDAAILGLFRTKHARPNDPRTPFGHGGLQCEACHGPGDAHAEARGKEPAGIVDFGSKALAPVTRQNAQCLTCRQTNVADAKVETVFKAGNRCGNCNFFQTAQAKGAYAPCLIFPGKSVNTNGWCRSWVAKVK